MRRQKSTNARYGNIANKVSAGPASGNSSFLPSISGRPTIDAYGAHGGTRVNASMNSSNSYVNKKLVLKDFMKVDWSQAPIFSEYILADNDRYFKFRDQANGTLSQA